MILFVNACVKKNSRTKRIADKLIERLSKKASEENSGEEILEVKLEDISFPKTDEKFLEYRDDCIARGNFSDEYFSLAKNFAKADIIVIAAPYYDLSFPASLKQYVEHINVLGITFEYTDEGYPKSLCNAKKLYYVTTAGGAFVPEEFGYGYIKSLAQNFYGIQECEKLQAVGLDVVGADIEGIVNECIDKIADM